jgi:hypothetical protein
MDGLRMLELIEEYREAKAAAAWGGALPGRTAGRTVEEIAADFDDALRAVLAPR